MTNNIFSSNVNYRDSISNGFIPISSFGLNNQEKSEFKEKEEAVAAIDESIYKPQQAIKPKKDPFVGINCYIPQENKYAVIKKLNKHAETNVVESVEVKFEDNENLVTVEMENLRYDIQVKIV